MNTICQIVECPRDAMQGIQHFIPTELKIRYINELLKCGFHTLDAGSFVSHKAIPQMRDTTEVLETIDWQKSNTKLLVIVANRRGAEDAVKVPQVSYLGYPFSISETFQLRNTNASIEESWSRVEEIQQLCLDNQKELVIYISMGFGNPYGDEWNAGIVCKTAEKLVKMGIKIISLSDTIGVSNPENISYLFQNLIPTFPEITFGAHLHTTPQKWEEKIVAAWESGCRRFDGAIKGFGGCPMAKDELTGNFPTEKMLAFLQQKYDKDLVDYQHFNSAYVLSSKVFFDVDH